MEWMFQSVCYLAFLSFASSQSALGWWDQVLESPYGGKHTGVKLFDVNNDGFDDILFAAGRHSIDQSYVRINLGFDDEGYHQFSDPIPLGSPGGFYQIDVARLSSLGSDHVAVLLAGGSCGDPNACELGEEQPAVMLDVHITGCSVFEPHKYCTWSYTEIWSDLTPEGDRNGAFESSIGDGVDPAVILVGKHGIKVFEPSNGVFPAFPTYHLTQAQKQQGTSATIRRASSLATGIIGDRPGFVGMYIKYMRFWTCPEKEISVGQNHFCSPLTNLIVIVGVRTYTPPNPLIGVYKKADGSYDWFSFAGDSDQYGSANGFTEGLGIAMADLNGDSRMDIVEASSLQPGFIEDGVNVTQNIFLWNEDNTAQLAAGGSVNISQSTLFDSDTPGYKVAVGNIYPDSNLPDIVHGLLDSRIKVFANLGTENGNFLGFREAVTLRVPNNCQIRDIAVASLAPCTVSIVTAVMCQRESAEEGNYLFSADTACAPTISPWPTTSPWPTWSPTVSLWPTMTSLPSQSVQPTESVVSNTETQATVTTPPTLSSSKTLTPSLSPTEKPDSTESQSPSSELPTNRPTSSASSFPPPTSSEASPGPSSSAPSLPPFASSEDSPGSSSTAPSLPPFASSDASSGMPSDFPSLMPSDAPSIVPTSITSAPISITSEPISITSAPTGTTSAPTSISTPPTTITTVPTGTDPPVASITPVPTETPSKPTAQSDEREVDAPTTGPDPFIQGDIDTGDVDFDKDPDNEDESEPRMWQFMALALCGIMIIVGCMGIIKLELMRRRAKRNSSTDSAVISLYLDEDEIDALEKR